MYLPNGTAVAVAVLSATSTFINGYLSTDSPAAYTTALKTQDAPSIQIARAPATAPEVPNAKVALANEVPAMAAPWVSRVDNSLGVPGYLAINVPLKQAPKLEEIPHSAVAAAIDQSGNSTYLEFSTSPADGPYFQTHKGTNVTTALEWAEQHGGVIPFIITNPGKTGMCILGSVTNHAPGDGTTFMFAPEKTRTNNMLYVSPKSTVQVGNFLSNGLANFNGRMESHFGCDKTCGKCGGPTKPIFTLAEWALIKKSENSEGMDEGFWSNLSNVDGLSSNVDITVYKKDGKECHARKIETNAKKVKKICPAHLFWKDKDGNVGCSSECKHTGSDIHCCTGAFNPDAGCPPSSTFLKELTPDAYSYATDDHGQVNICKEPKAVHIAFTAIH